MKTALRFVLPCLFVLPIVAACSAAQDAAGAAEGLCCKDFKVGADLKDATFGLEGEIQGNFRAFAQAAGDLSAVAQASVDEVAAACRAIAIDGGATNENIDDADGKTGPDRAKAWCEIAVSQIKGAFGGNASGKLVIDFQPIKCQASFKAAADCQANCSVSGKCDVKASAKCEGKATLSCKGECKASGEAPSIACEGGCSGSCSGSCTAEGSVAIDCNGKCDGECKAAGEGSTESGVQADGTCKGTCSGTCTPPAGSASVTCKGVCKGSCDASCKPTPGKAEIKCDGECEGGVAVSCEGELKSDCKVDAKCSGNCNASVQAKAECTPPSVSIKASAALAGDVRVSLLVKSLELNLPKILVVAKARGEAFAKLVGDLAGSAEGTFDGGDLSVEAVACVLPIVATLAAATENAEASVSASVSVVGAVGLK